MRQHHPHHTKDELKQFELMRQLGTPLEYQYDYEPDQSLWYPLTVVSRDLTHLNPDARLRIKPCISPPPPKSENSSN